MSLSVALDSRFLNHPGIGRYTENLLRHIPSDISVSPVVTPQLRDDVLNVRPSSTPIVVNDDPFTVREQLSIPLALRSHDVDVYHATQFNVPLLWSGTVLTTVHDCAYDRVPAEFGDSGPVARYYYRFMMSRAVTQSARVIAVSEQTKTDLVQLYNAESVCVVPLGVDESMFQPDGHSVTLNAPYFLFVGSNRPRKNLERIVDAYNSLVLTVEDPPKFVVVGENDDRFFDIDKTIAQRSLEGQLVSLGSVDDATLRSLYANALALVFPTLYEGFGLPILESMAAGTSVITSDREPMADIAGDAARLVDPESVSSITTAMQDLFEDDDRRNTLRMKGRERAAQFEWSKTATQTATHYRKMAGDQR